LSYNCIDSNSKSILLLQNNYFFHTLQIHHHIHLIAEQNQCQQYKARSPRILPCTLMRSNTCPAGRSGPIRKLRPQPAPRRPTLPKKYRNPIPIIHTHQNFGRSLPQASSHAKHTQSPKRRTLKKRTAKSSRSSVCVFVGVGLIPLITLREGLVK
jgi:hypothetical protein